MFEPIARNVSHDVFGLNHALTASKFLDSYSVFDWGRMPDAIPHRGKFQAILQAFINHRISSSEQWKNFLRSPQALQFRKAASATFPSGSVNAHLNELADRFPMKTSGVGVLTEENFKAGLFERMDFNAAIAAEVSKDASHQFFVLNEVYPEEKIPSFTIMGKTVWDFSHWKKKTAPKAFPFEFDCEFAEEFPRITLRCTQKSLFEEVSISEALLITELPAARMEELLLRAAWIAGFIQFQLKSQIPPGKTIRIRMGINAANEFVFLDSAIDFHHIENELQKYYSSTVWGKSVLEIQNQARLRGTNEWKKFCSEPAPWLDSETKNYLSTQYQQMILGMMSCLSE